MEESHLAFKKLGYASFPSTYFGSKLTEFTSNDEDIRYLFFDVGGGPEYDFIIERSKQLSETKPFGLHKE